MDGFCCPKYLYKHDKEHFYVAILSQRWAKKLFKKNLPRLCHFQLQFQAIVETEIDQDIFQHAAPYTNNHFWCPFKINVKFFP